MVDITRRAVLAGLAALAAPAPSLAGLSVTKMGSAIAPVSAVPLPVPEVPPVELELRHLFDQCEWRLDVYRGRIALRDRHQWYWAQLRHDVLTMAPRCQPNMHEWFITQDAFDDPDAALWLPRAVDEGWLTIGEPLSIDDRHLVRHVRYGRVGVARAHIEQVVGPSDIHFVFGLDDLLGQPAPWGTEAAMATLEENYRSWQRQWGR